MHNFCLLLWGQDNGLEILVRSVMGYLCISLFLFVFDIEEDVVPPTLVLNSVFGVSSNITKPYLFNSYGLPTKNPGYCSLAGIPGYRMLAFCQETAIHRFPVERAWLLNKSFCHVHVPIVSFSCAGKHVKAS